MAVYQRVRASNTVVEQNSMIDLIDLISSYSYISCVIVDSCDLMRLGTLKKETLNSSQIPASFHEITWFGGGFPVCG